MGESHEASSDVPNKPQKPVDFSSFKKPTEMKEGLKEKLEGTVSGPCKNESMKNNDGRDEKNLIGLNEKQRESLGVDLKRYVDVLVEGETEVKRYMVVKGLKENIGTDNFTANELKPGSKISIEKSKVA